MTFKLNERRRALKLIGAGALSASPLLSVRAQSAEPIVLSSILPLSGPFAQYGKELARGVELGVEAVNAKGLQVGGRRYRIELRTFDDKTDATTAARLVERAATVERSNFVLAGAGSVIAKSIIPMAQRMRIPVVAQWATLNGVFEGQKGNPFFFGGMAPFSKSYDLVWSSLSQQNNPKLRTVAMISPQDELGVFVNRELPGALQKAGLSHLHTEFFPAGSHDFATVVERCAQRKPDVLLLNCYTPQIVGVFKQMQAVKYFPPAIVVQAPTRLAEALGSDVNGAFVPSLWAPAGTLTRDDYIGTSADFAKAYQARYRETPPDFVAGCGASNVVLCALVAAKAGTVVDQQALLKGFRTFEGETFFSPVKFDELGLNSKADVYAAQFHDGRPKLVNPVALKEVATVHPFPLWRG